MSIDYCYKHHEYRDTDYVVECPRCEEEKDQPSINKINNKMAIEITKELEKIIERIRERTKYNDWASNSFLLERAGEIKKVINKLNK